MIKKQLFILHVDYAGWIGLAKQQRGFHLKKNCQRGEVIHQWNRMKTARDHEISFSESWKVVIRFSCLVCYPSSPLTDPIENILVPVHCFLCVSSRHTHMHRVGKGRLTVLSMQNHSLLLHYYLLVIVFLSIHTTVNLWAHNWCVFLKPSLYNNYFPSCCRPVWQKTRGQSAWVWNFCPVRVGAHCERQMLNMCSSSIHVCRDFSLIITPG